MPANEHVHDVRGELSFNPSDETGGTPNSSAAPTPLPHEEGAVHGASHALSAPAGIGGRMATCVLVSAALMLGVWLLLSGEAAADSHLAGDVIDFDIIVSDTPLTVGDTIVFTNSGAQPHTVTDRAGTFDTNGIAPGDSAEVTFDVPGTYEIFCRINPGSMNATVVVEPGDDPPSEIRIQTFDENREGETLRFDPPEAEVPTGSWVTVANVGGAPHTLTADDGSFDTGEIAPGAEQGRFAGEHARFRVDEPGVYDFRCLVHPEAMQGTLTVVGDAVDPEEPDPEPPPDEPSDPGAGAADSAAVTIVDFSFDPFEVAVLPAAEVTWTNEDGAPHTATFDEVEGRVEGLDTGNLSTGESGTLRAPDAPGSYSYFCAIHSSMRGVLVVAADAPPPADDGDDGGDDGNGGDEPAGDDGGEPAGDDGDEADPAAAPPAEDQDSNTAALVGAIAIVVAGLGAIVIALRGGRRREDAPE